MASDAESQLSKLVATSNNKFTSDLYKILASNSENTFFSPFSIHVILTLAYLGAKGDTAEELEKHLHLPEKREDLLNGIQKLLQELKNPQLNTATEMFVEKTYQLKASFQDEAKKYLNSESQVMDFKTAAEEAAQLINSWVSSQTNQKIKDLIPAGVLNADTRLVLVNAIHFKENWMKEFRESNTYEQDFYRSKEVFSKVKMMHLTSHFNYLEENSYKVLQMMYKEPSFSMVIFLPKEVDGLSALEQELPSIDLSSTLEKMNNVKVNVALPKFKLEQFIDLNAALKALGISTMFDGRRADFTGMHEPSEDRLVVSKVLHKAFVDVTEEGTEAAAATGAAMALYCSLIVFEEKVFDFIVDHPFMFRIYRGNTVIFVGKLLKAPN